jgi:hypothetical protein
VFKGELLSTEAFCGKACISRNRVLYLTRRGEIFALQIGTMRYFSAVLADKSLDRHRLSKLLRRLPSGTAPIAQYLFLVGRKGFLGDKSPVQSVQRA